MTTKTNKSCQHCNGTGGAIGSGYEDVNGEPCHAGPYVFSGDNDEFECPYCGYTCPRSQLGSEPDCPNCGNN